MILTTNFKWLLTYSCDGERKRYKLYRNEVYTGIFVEEPFWKFGEGGYQLIIKDTMSNTILMSSGDLDFCMKSGYDFYLKAWIGDLLND